MASVIINYESFLVLQLINGGVLRIISARYYDVCIVYDKILSEVRADNDQ